MASDELLGGLSTEADATPRSSASAALPRGHTVARYLILDRVGAGGMGVVYSAYDPQLDRKVALKLLHAEVGHGEPEHSQLLREGRAIARLACPEVVAVHDVGSHDGRTFVAMEFVDGQDLAAWLRARPRPWREVVKAFVQAGAGLAAAHAAGLVHRDFKPANVLIGHDGRVRVTDFGLARASGGGGSADARPADGHTPDALAGGTTTTGMVVGTPAYMSPEQHAGRPAEARADQFSFCVALWEGLYGVRPFAGDSIGELVAAIRAGRPRTPPPGTKVPARIQRALLRGLSARPDDRHPSMGALLKTLTTEPLGLKRWWVAGIGAAALALVAAVAGYAGGRRPEQLACRGAERKLAGIWDANGKSSIQKAFLASAKPYAGVAWSAVERGLDDYSARWLAMHTEACEASQRKEQSPEMLDLRMQCLDLRRRGLGALTGLLAKADADTVERGAASVEALPALADCADTAALAAPLPLPADPAVRAAIAAQRGRLAEARVLLGVGQVAAALAAAQAVAAVAPLLGWRPLYADALLVAGTAQRAAGNYPAARDSLQRSAWAAEAARADFTSAQAWDHLADLVGRTLAKYAEAAPLVRQAEAALERAGPDDGLTAAHLSHLGLLLDAQGKFAESRELLERALALVERAHGRDSVAAAQAVSDVGLVLKSLGKFDEAVAAHDRARAIYERLLGPEHPAVGRALTNSGNALTQQGKFEAGAERYQRALAIFEKSLAADHPEVGALLINLGIARNRQERFTEALAYFDRAMAIEEKQLGPEHPMVAHILNGAGIAYQGLHRWDEAVRSYQRALAIREKVEGPEHPSVAKTLMNLGNTAYERGDYPAAIAYHARALRIEEKTLGLDHPDLAAELTNMGTIAEHFKKYQDALGYHSRAAALLDKAGSPDVAYALLGIATCHVQTGQPAKAIAPLERALAVHQDNKAPLGDVAQVEMELAWALWDSGKDRPRARRLALAAREHWSHEAPLPEQNLAIVDDWLAKHR